MTRKFSRTSTAALGSGSGQGAGTDSNSRSWLYWTIFCFVLATAGVVLLTYIVIYQQTNLDSWTQNYSSGHGHSHGWHWWWHSRSSSSSSSSGTGEDTEFILAGVSSSEETSDVTSVSSSTDARGYSLHSVSDDEVSSIEDAYYRQRGGGDSVKDARVPRGHPGTDIWPRTIEQNNLRLDHLGGAGSIMDRYADAEGYACDQSGSPVLTELEYPRNISNAIFHQGDSVDIANFTAESTLGVNALFVFFGQFVDHQMVLTAPGVETFQMRVYADDPYIAGEPNITVKRMQFVYIDECRQALNRKSSFIDLATVYGSSHAVAQALRTHEHGLLKTSEINGREHLPIANAEADEADLRTLSGQIRFFAGDPRVTEVPPLTAIHLLFVRNHNHIARRLRAVDKHARGWSDDQLYTRARMINIWTLQRILYHEWLPMLLGESVIPYIGTEYSRTNDPLVRHESTILFRVGHDMLPTNVSYVLPENYGTPSVRTNIALRNTFMNPALIVDKGADSYVMGAMTQPAQEVDARITDEVRNFLFTSLGSAALHDLAALSIGRSEELGIPRCNVFRAAIGMSPLTNPDLLRPIPASLSSVYPSIADLHVFVCGLLEVHEPGALVGPMVKRVLLDQFVRMASGDPMFFTASEMTEFERAIVFGESGTMAGVIKNNMDIGYLAPECVEADDNPFLTNVCSN